MVRDCLPRSLPFVASAVRLALIAPSILRCRGTPRPVALGLTPLPKGTTSKGGGRCPGEPHAQSHSGPMHIGEDVQEPTPLPTSHAQCPEQASAPLHLHLCRHPRRCRLQRRGCEVQILQQERTGDGGGVTIDIATASTQNPLVGKTPRHWLGGPWTRKSLFRTWV